MVKRFLNVKQVAEYLGVSLSAIRKWIRESRIPFCRFNGAIRFDKERIDQWVIENSHPVL